MKDIKIKDVALVTNVNGDEKIPVSNGSGKPAAVTINQILEKVPATDLSEYATNESVDQKIADLIGGAPETLDTLKEISDALADNSDILELLDDKADRSEIPTKVSQLKNDVSYVVDDIIPNGVYAISSTGSLIDYNLANTSALGVALVVGEHKFMIAKSDATVNTSYDTKTTLRWGLNGKDLAGIVNNDKSDGITEKGYLPKPDGTYNPVSNLPGGYLSGDFTTWTAGALSDFNGASNTAAIIAGYTEYGVSMDKRDMCAVLNTFNASNNFKDWYVPALGQLALIYLNMTEINAALAKIGGTALSGEYYSSSEQSIYYVWTLDLGISRTITRSKADDYHVRFVRNILPKLKERVSKLESKSVELENQLSNIYTKSQVDDLIPSDYITEEVLESKGYLTEHQDLSNYVTKEEINSSENQTTYCFDITKYVNDDYNETITYGEVKDLINSIKNKVSIIGRFRTQDEVSDHIMDLPIKVSWLNTPEISNEAPLGRYELINLEFETNDYIYQIGIEFYHDSYDEFLDSETSTIRLNKYSKILVKDDYGTNTFLSGYGNYEPVNEVQLLDVEDWAQSDRNRIIVYKIDKDIQYEIQHANSNKHVVHKYLFKNVNNSNTVKVDLLDLNTYFPCDFLNGDSFELQPGEVKVVDRFLGDHINYILLGNSYTQSKET